MRILGVVASSNPYRYQLTQTYTTTTTYTTPNGINEVAFIGIAKGGNGNFGYNAGFSFGAAGGGGGGGGAAIAVWNVPTTAGKQFTLTINSSGVTFNDGLGNSFAALSGFSSSSSIGGAGGTTIATGTGFLPYRTFANGGAGGNGGGNKTTDGGGNSGSNGANRNQCYDPSWFTLGLPNNIYSGYGGGGGGGGARDIAPVSFFSGGAGGTLFDGFASGGGGGSAFQDDLYVNGETPGLASILYAGGGGGGGGAFQTNQIFGVGGSGQTAVTTQVIYVYER